MIAICSKDTVCQCTPWATRPTGLVRSADGRCLQLRCTQELLQQPSALRLHPHQPHTVMTLMTWQSCRTAPRERLTSHKPFLHSTTRRKPSSFHAAFLARAIQHAANMVSVHQVQLWHDGRCSLTWSQRSQMQPSPSTRIVCSSTEGGPRGTWRQSQAASASLRT